MNDDGQGKSQHRRWAEFRFSVIGHLLAAPPLPGELKKELKRLATKSWQHPLSEKPKSFGFSTIETWYYAARKEVKDPVGRLRSKVRSDLGKVRRMSEEAQQVLAEQYTKHSSWTYQLHADNLAAYIQKHRLGAAPSYPTVRRYMKNHGLRRKKKVSNSSQAKALNRLESREVRSYEVEYVGGLWHLDYHHSPLKVLISDGTWTTPVCLGVFDDHSRLCCHLQWYLAETAENLVHAFSQALQKRGMPRELLTDNGSPMISAEFKAGLTRFGITSNTTLAYSPYQNGKCEFAWTKVDGRLMAMLEGYQDLTLKFLNDATQAWIEMEYNQKIHRDTDERPIDRYLQGKDVSRQCPKPDEIKLAFQREITRIQRRSDGTTTVDGTRFEIPSRFRHLEKLTIKYAFWDLSHVHLVDFRSGVEIARLYPVDKAKNADAKRRFIEDPVLIATPMLTKNLPPLLTALIDEYEALGIKPAYLTKFEENKS